MGKKDENAAFNAKLIVVIAKAGVGSKESRYELSRDKQHISATQGERQEKAWNCRLAGRPGTRGKWRV